jgi:hypothetical protein
MGAGRPTKYTEEILAKAEEYLNGGYKESDDLFPSHVGLALYLELAKSTVYDWASDPEKKPFSDIFERCLNMQEKALINNSLLGEYNSTIAKVMLTKHGYSDKQQTELTGANGEAIQTESKVSWNILPVTPIDKVDESNTEG